MNISRVLILSVSALAALRPASAFSAEPATAQSALTADVPAATYAARRARVLTELGGCVAVLSAQGETTGVTEDFRQDADFLFLTGVNEADAWLLFSPHAKSDKVTLFLKSRDPEHER